jgi:sialate O-acetylesterase
LTVKGGDLRHFEIAGKDKKFVPAKAEIDSDTVVVWSDKVKSPVAVRYAFSNAPQPEANLYNSASLPASSFRTDNWEGETYGKK